MLRTLAEAAVLVAMIASGVFIYDALEDRVTALEAAQIMPSGTMLPYAGQGGTSKPPEGWVQCGSMGTPEMDGRFLIGTSKAGQVGSFLGTVNGLNDGTYKTGYEVDGKEGHPPEGPEGADNGGGRNWLHKHKLTLPVVKVLFLCKQ